MMLKDSRYRLFSPFFAAILLSTLVLAGCQDNEAGNSEAVPAQDEAPPATEHSSKGPPPQSGRPVQAEMTPMVEAIRDDDAERVMALLEAGSDVNEQDANWYSLLHHAAGAGRYEIVQILLDHGAEINIRGRLNVTPLHWAVRFNHMDTVRLLVESGADINARGGTGDQFTPLGLAVHTNYVDIVDYLISVGAEM